MGSSLPNYDAKDQKDRHRRDREKKTEKTKGRLQVSSVQYRTKNSIWCMNNINTWCML